MKMQIPYKCEKYTPNDNLNKTCDNKTRCKIYYSEECKEYEEKENEQNINDILDNLCNINNNT